MDKILGMVGTVVPVASLLVSMLNQYVRQMQEKGQAVPAWMLHLNGILNVCALNGDKALQMIKLAKGAK